MSETETVEEKSAVDELREKPALPDLSNASLREQLKLLFDFVCVEHLKNEAGNLAAGVRVRKALRSMRTVASLMTKDVLEKDKQRRLSNPKSSRKTVRTKADLDRNHARAFGRDIPPETI